MTTENMKINEDLKLSFNQVFQFLLISYLLLLLINEFKKITFINLNYLMIAVIIFGILTILFPVKIKQDKTKIKRKHILFIILLGIIGAIIIYLKIKELGWLSYLISGIAGILIILLSYMVLKDEDNI